MNTEKLLTKKIEKISKLEISKHIVFYTEQETPFFVKRADINIGWDQAAVFIYGLVASEYEIYQSDYNDVLSESEKKELLNKMCQYLALYNEDKLFVNLS